MSFIEGVREAARQYLCEALDGTNNLAGLYSRYFNPLTGNLLLNGRNYIRASLCGLPPEDLPENPPFLGGQCLTLYSITTRVRARRFTDPPGVFSVDQTTVRSPYGGRIGNAFIQETATQFIPVLNVQSGDAFVPVGSFLKAVFAEVQIQIISVSRLDGLPDNCGNLPTPIEPSPVPLPPVTIPVPYTDPDGITFFIPVAFAAGFIYVNADGELNVPITINVDGRLNMTGNFNFNGGDIKINIGGGGNGGSPSDGPGGGGDGGGPAGPDPDDPPPPPTGENPPPPPERDQPGKKILVGVYTALRIDNQQGITTIFQAGTNPDIRVPNLGFVNFSYQVAEGVSAWSEDIPIKNLSQVIFASDRLPCLDFGFTLRRGVSGRVIPLFKLTS